MTFPEQIIDAFLSEPDSAVIEHGARRVSRGELLTMTRRIATGMRAAGLGKRSGVAMVTGVTPEALAAYLAGFCVGARVIGVRPGYSEAQRDHVLSNGVDAVVTDEVITELLTADDEPLVLAGEPGDAARLVYTSGSTGRPKGCAQTYRAMGAHWTWDRARWSPDTVSQAACTDRYLLFGSLASVVVHDYLALCLFHGGTAVIPEPDEKPLFPYAIERYRITATIMNVPRLHHMLDILREEPIDTSSLRALVVAGSPLAPHRLAEATERLGPVVYQGYGQSETGGLTTLTPADIAAGVLSSVGRAHPRVEISIRDGEIYARNDYHMSEYWGDPVETAEVIVDGWVRTRDLGYLDDAGYLHLTGRTRDIVIVNGYPVYAGPIEQVLIGHPDIDQAYVVGSPDEQTGEAVHAFVIPLTGRTPNRSELAAMVSTQLGPSSAPKTITVLDNVPIAPSGKPDKRSLKPPIG
jgi:fatty-acyl-CoA synthase